MVFGNINARCRSCGRYYISGDCIRHQCDECHRKELSAELIAAADIEASTPINSPSPTVTVPREVWERMKAESEAWRATKEVWTRDGDGICFDLVKSEIDHQIERLQKHEGNAS